MAQLVSHTGVCSLISLSSLHLHENGSTISGVRETLKSLFLLGNSKISLSVVVKPPLMPDYFELLLY